MSSYEKKTLNKKLMAIIAAVLAVVIAVSVVLVVKNKNINNEKASTKTITVADETNDAWKESAVDFVYNAPLHLKYYDKSAWIPPIENGFGWVYQLIDLDFDEIPEIIVYGEGISQGAGNFIDSVFCFNGRKYTECEIKGISWQTQTGTGMIKAYKNTETGKTVFRAGDVNSEMLSSDDVKKYSWDNFANYFVSREFVFENGVLSCVEYSNKAIYEGIILEGNDVNSRYKALEAAREYVETFEKKYTLIDDYKNTIVSVYNEEEYNGDENADVLDIYHTYVDKTFAEAFVKGYINGEKELVLPVNVVTWEDGVEDVICNAVDLFTENMLSCYMMKYKLIDMDSDEIPELLVHSVSPTGGAVYFFGVCVWNGVNAYDVYEYEQAFGENEERHVAEVMFCRDNKTGKTVAISDVLNSDWLESDDVTDYDQAWRWAADTRIVTFENGKIKLDNVIDLTEYVDALGDFSGVEKERKKALEILRKEVKTFENDFTILENEEANVSLSVWYDAMVSFDEAPETYTESVNVKEIHKVIDNYKSIIKK